MPQNAADPISRRRFLKVAGATALVASAGPAAIIPGRARPKTLKILITLGNTTVAGQLTKYTKSWGTQHDVEVIVDTVKLGSLAQHVAAEAAAQEGHDLIFSGVASLAAYEDQLIDHRDIYEEVQRRHGKLPDLAIKSTYNPKTKRYWSFLDAYGLHMVNYRKDLWDKVDMVPDSWENVRSGGRRINFYHEYPIGIPFAPGPDSESAWRALMYSFGASVQDADNAPTLKSKETLEAIKFAKALYDEAMSEDVLSWDGWFSNNRAMLAGEVSLTLNAATSITRPGERKKIPVTDNIWLAPPPQGPASRLAPINNWTMVSIWQFAENIDDAKRFLTDWAADSEAWRHRFIEGDFGNLPGFPQLLPDLKTLVANDTRATPPDKYQVLADASKWTTNFGYPGYFNVAISEIYDTGLIPTMFAHAATGKMTPEEALTQADQEVRQIFDKWRALDKV